MKFILFATSLLLFSTCSKPKKSSAPLHSDTTVMAPPVAPGSPDQVGQPQQGGGSSAQAGTWRYGKTTDRSGKPVYKASLTASNRLQFAYPYTGGSTATLTIRKGADDTYVYLEVSNGQFNRSFQSGSARVRFDGSPAVTYTLSAAENGRANIVFFDASPTLVDRIKAAHALTIDVSFPSQRVQTIDFRTAGLRWNH